jgi:uncharacterized membrane protein
MKGRKPPTLWEDIRGVLFRVEHVAETRAFILVNVLDIVMTWFLLNRQNGFYESNPLAQHILHSWGPKGMIYFKLGAVAFVCIIVQIVNQRRPDRARMILTLGTLIVGCVVIYSLVLLIRHGDLAIPVL